MHMISDDELFQYGTIRAKVTHGIARMFNVGCLGYCHYDIPKAICVLAEATSEKVRINQNQSVRRKSLGIKSLGDSVRKESIATSMVSHLFVIIDDSLNLGV